MNDRELLEAAAKAAGMDVVHMALSGFNIVSGPRVGLWNPLTDDGDALRLAVKLEIDLHFYKGHEVDALFDGRRRSCSEPWGQDGMAAARRAIVCAAAKTSVNGEESA